VDPKISVIIPIYNSEKYLKYTLDAICSQTYRNLDIVCVLDCPTDNSPKIVEEMAKEDYRIKIVRNSKNMGLPATRNVGIENADGEYLHFMDSDDLLNPDFYNALVNAALSADADIAACSFFYENKPKRSIVFYKNKVASGQRKMNMTEVTINGWSLRYLIKKSLWDSHNLSFPNLVPMEDMPVMIPMMYYANRAVSCPDAIYFYKNRSNSILNQEHYDEELRNQRNEMRWKSEMVWRHFMRTHKIRRVNKLCRLRYKRNDQTVCTNDPVEYGKIDKKISVIIPVSNVKNHFQLTFDSVRFQTYKNLEIICVLDSQTDNSASIPATIAKDDSRVKLARYEKHMGLQSAKNIGVENASGEYMHFVNPGDIISPDFYDFIISAAAKADADVAACSVL